jgi:D-sedoheptulose 7-phosphate isomerase
MTMTQHLDAVHRALDDLDLPAVERVAASLVDVLKRHGRVLVAGNGGSAAHAQHFSAELVGRYRDPHREPCSAIALHADTSSLSAVANDFGWDEVYARQIRAHGRPGDALLAISTSGASTNLLRAATIADRLGIAVLALTGPAPNRLADCARAAVCVSAAATPTVQEVHQVVVHMLCDCIDRELGCGPR